MRIHDLWHRSRGERIADGVQQPPNGSMFGLSLSQRLGRTPQSLDDWKERFFLHVHVPLLCNAQLPKLLRGANKRPTLG